MFGLGAMECLLILFLAVMLFGHGFLVKTTKTLASGVTDFGKSFQKASKDDALAEAKEPAALQQAKS